MTAYANWIIVYIVLVFCVRVDPLTATADSDSDSDGVTPRDITADTDDTGSLPVSGFTGSNRQLSVENIDSEAV